MDPLGEGFVSDYNGLSPRAAGVDFQSGRLPMQTAAAPMWETTSAGASVPSTVQSYEARKRQAALFFKRETGFQPPGVVLARNRPHCSFQRETGFQPRDFDFVSLLARARTEKQRCTIKATPVRCTVRSICSSEIFPRYR
jgi:hypothetical protein